MGKNAIVGQSGGPTSVINASLAGVFESCKNRGADIVYGMCNGVAGLLEERVVDLSTLLTDDLDIELLKRTPSSFLGSCRYKLPDWHEDETVYKKLFAILEKLRELTGGVDTLDLLISNFVYEKEGERRKKVMRYKHVLPEYRMFGWEDVGRFHVGQYILMHSVIYRTKLLRECGLKLPEHTFYVDNIYVFEPLPYVRNMYYLDVNFYRYFIGRSDQSVNEKVMTGRIDQQIKVNQIMTDYFVEKKSEIMGNKPLAKYMLSYLDIITTISSILLIRINTPESLEKKRELLNYISQKDKKVYRKLRYGLLGNCMNLPGKTGRWISVEGYKICQKFFGFN